MSAFQQKLDNFVQSQRGKTAAEVQNNADAFALEAQQYAPKERWGNIFKYIIAYALGITLGHLLVGAIARGADHLAPSDLPADQLAQELEAGRFDADDFNLFLEQEYNVTNIDFAASDMAALDGVEWESVSSVADGDVMGNLGDVVGSVTDLV